MIRRFALLLLFFIPLVMTGCSEENSSAPQNNQAHPFDWIKTHPPGALASVNFSDCTGCHAADLKGSGEAVSCYSCHAYNTTQPFVVHPADWTDPYTKHRGYAAVNGFTQCVNCHGNDLHGSTAAPSCFSASIDSRSCHTAGPGQVPHPLDGTYLSGAIHGPDAEVNLTVCQLCHAQSGGPGSNPRFNVGIDSVSGTGCEACHGVNYAHPAEWTGQNGLSHDAAGNLQNACTLCHGVNLDGLDGVGSSCLGCHGVSPAASPSGCASCHNLPPSSGAPVGDVRPNRQGQHNRTGHSLWISTTPGQTCGRCHNGAGVGTAAHFDGSNPAEVNFLRPDASDTISAVSSETNTTCNGACHVVIGTTIDFIYSHDNKSWY